MIFLIVKLVFSYLLGSVVGSLLLGRLRGVDIRQQGSGNAGATNALRTQGKWFALGTALIDFGKGVVAAALIAPLDYGSPTSPLSLLETQMACGFAAAIGHCYPWFYRFKGGKGAGTLFGVVLWLFPWTALLMLLAWLLMLTSTGIVGLSTVVAGLIFPIALYLFYGPLGANLAALALGAAMFLTFTHRSNLLRWQQGREHRFERARILHRWFARTKARAKRR